MMMSSCKCFCVIMSLNSRASHQGLHAANRYTLQKDADDLVNDGNAFNNKKTNIQMQINNEMSTDNALLSLYSANGIMNPSSALMAMSVPGSLQKVGRRRLGESVVETGPHPHGFILLANGAKLPKAPPKRGSSAEESSVEKNPFRQRRRALQDAAVEMKWDFMMQLQVELKITSSVDAFALGRDANFENVFRLGLGKAILEILSSQIADLANKVKSSDFQIMTDYNPGQLGAVEMYTMDSMMAGGRCTRCTRWTR